MIRVVIGECRNHKKVEKKIEYIRIPYKQYIPIPFHKEQPKPIIIQLTQPVKMGFQGYGHMGMGMGGMGMHGMGMYGMGMDSMRIPIVHGMDMDNDMSAMGTKRYLIHMRPRYKKKGKKQKDSDRSSAKKKSKLNGLLRVKRFLNIK